MTSKKIQGCKSDLIVYKSVRIIRHRYREEFTRETGSSSPLFFSPASFLLDGHQRVNNIRLLCVCYLFWNSFPCRWWWISIIFFFDSDIMTLICAISRTFIYCDEGIMNSWFLWDKWGEGGEAVLYTFGGIFSQLNVLMTLTWFLD